MKFDRTAVVIRERGLIGLLELALLVSREMIRQLLPLWALVIVPVAVVDHLVLVPLLFDVSIPVQMPGRYLFHLTLLIYLQWPVATLPATLFLGETVFGGTPRVRTVFERFAAAAGRLVYVEGFRRLTIPALAVVLVGAYVPGENVELVGFMTACELAIVGLVGLIRLLRPFTLEVLLLELNPLTAGDDRVLTLGRRAGTLHAGSGDLLFGRWILETLLIGALVWIVFATAYWLQGQLINDWWPNVVMYLVLWPATLWIVGAFAGIVRFLSYIDLRIRQEGWEMELVLRAEASRLTGARLR